MAVLAVVVGDSVAAVFAAIARCRCAVFAAIVTGSIAVILAVAQFGIQHFKHLRFVSVAIVSDVVNYLSEKAHEVIIQAVLFPVFDMVALNVKKQLIVLFG